MNDSRTAMSPSDTGELALAGQDDTRVTWDLIIDVVDALERAGFRKGDDVSTGKAIGLICSLGHVYEGKQ